MPATVNSTVGSCGMRLADGTIVWPRAAKNPVNALRRSAAVLTPTASGYRPVRTRPAVPVTMRLRRAASSSGTRGAPSAPAAGPESAADNGAGAPVVGGGVDGWVSGGVAGGCVAAPTRWRFARSRSWDSRSRIAVRPSASAARALARRSRMPSVARVVSSTGVYVATVRRTVFLTERTTYHDVPRPEPNPSVSQNKRLNTAPPGGQSLTG